MAATSRIDFDDGTVWAVGSGAIFPWDREDGRNISVCVPIDSIRGMSAEEVGSRVLELVPDALGLELDVLGYQLTLYGDREEKLRPVPQDALEEYRNEYNALDPEHRSDAATHCFSYVMKELSDREAAKQAKEAERLAARQAKRQTVAQAVRVDLAKRYHKTLVALGRRDGFACCNCGAAGSDLEIDHRIPIVQGGSNNPDNLQLLCKSCNSGKGGKTMEQWQGATVAS